MDSNACTRTELGMRLSSTLVPATPTIQPGDIRGPSKVKSTAHLEFHGL